MPRALPCLLAGAAAIAGCAGAAPPSPGAPLTGQWGGDHVALVLTAEGGRLDYDCAAGTIAAPLRPDRAGNFAAPGTHTPGQGGPDRVDHVPPAFPALYSGTVRGATIELRVAIPANQTHLGPFRLRRDTAPNLTRCL